MTRIAPWIALAALLLLGVAATIYQLSRPSADGPDRRPRTAPGAVRTGPGIPSGPPAEGATDQPAGPSAPVGGSAETAAKIAHIEGIVRSQDGRPSAAIVTATGAMASPVSTRVGDDGRFAMDVAPGVWTIRAETPGHISTPGFVNLEEGDSAHLELTLLAAATIAGAVWGPDGQPVEGAVVVSTRIGVNEEEDGADAAGAVGATATTDTSGLYRLSVLAGMQNVRAEKAGYGPGFDQVSAEAGQETRCDLRLVKPLRICGRVLDKTGAPIEGAVVTAGWYGQSEGTFGGSYTRTATAAADGRYSLDDLRDGFHYVHATAKGFTTDAKYQIAAGSENVDFALAKGARIEGRVVRKSDGSPIESPSVLCRLVSLQAWEQNQVTVDAGGAFVVEAVGPGRHFIEARAKGFAPGQSEEFDVAVEQVITGVTVELTPGGTLRGVVRSSRTRAPVAGATITRLEKIGMMDVDADTWLKDPAGPCKTDEEGRFVMENLPAGRLRMRVNHDDYATLVRTIDIVEGKEAEEEFLVGDAGRIHGRVVDYGDRPKPGATVSAMSTSWTDQKTAQTDKDGAYEIQGLAAGTYMVVMYEVAEGAAQPRMNTQTVQVREGESVRVDFTPSDGVRLYGSVRQGGRVRPNVRMQFIATSGGGSMMMTQTDAAGNYELAGGRPGDYSVVVDNVMMKCTIPKGQREVRHDFDLPTGTVSGRVYDVRTRAKIVGAEVQAYRTGDAKGGMADFLDRFAGNATTDAEGAYELSGLAGGEYILQVTKDGYAAEMTAPFQIPADGNIGGVDVLLSGGAKIVGVVFDEACRPVADATFSLRDRRTGTPVAQTGLWMTKSDADGSFSLPGIRAGEYVLGVHAQGYASAQRVVRVAAGRDASVEVTLPAGGTLRLFARDATGVPVAGATIALIDAEGNAVESSMGIEDLFDPTRWKTGADGRLEWRGIAPGHYRGELKEGTLRARFEVDVLAGQVAEIAVEMR